MNPYERVNPVTEGINAFRAVDNIFRDRREEERAIEDRAYNRGRQEKSDAMAAESHGVTMATAKEQEKLRALADDERVLNGSTVKVKQWRLAQMNDPSTPPPSFDEKEMSTITRYLAANPTLSNDPSQLARQAQAGARLTKGLAEVAPHMLNDQRKAITAQDAPALFQDANVFLAQELNKGEDRYGNKDSRKELVAVYSDENNNLMWGVRVTPKDPSQASYEAPLTEMRSSDDAARVLATPAAAFAGYVQANADFAETAETAIASALARAGNKDALKDIQTQLNSEAAKVAVAKVAQAEEEHSPLTYEQKRQLFVGLMPKGHTYSTADLKRDAETMYPKPEKPEKKTLHKLEEGVGKGGAKRDVYVDDDGNRVIEGTAIYPKPDKEKGEKADAKGPTIRYVKVANAKRSDGTMGPGTMAFDMADPNHKKWFQQWVTSGNGAEVFPDQETTKDLATGDTVKSKVAPTQGAIGEGRVQSTRSAPDPKIAARIEELLVKKTDKGRIRKDLQAKGIDPATYGL